MMPAIPGDLLPRRTALVTGASRGIGLAICEQLAAAGVAVVLSARTHRDAARAATRLRTAGFDARALEIDVADEASIDRAVAELEATRVAVDILVNNAGVLPDGELLEMPERAIAESMAVHVMGPLRLIRALAPGMRARRYGRIVNVSSRWGAFADGLDGPGAYGLTKAALNALTVRCARELPSFVKVNAMCPGWARTRMGGRGAPVTPQAAARTAVWLAMLEDDGPTGGFFYERSPIPW